MKGIAIVLAVMAACICDWETKLYGNNDLPQSVEEFIADMLCLGLLIIAGLMYHTKTERN